MAVRTRSRARCLGFDDLEDRNLLDGTPTPVPVVPPPTQVPPAPVVPPPAPPVWNPTIVLSPAWHPPMAPPTVLYVYDGQDLGAPGQVFPPVADGSSFQGVAASRPGYMLNMGGCTDLNQLINIISAQVAINGRPYTSIVFLDHGSPVTPGDAGGQNFGNATLQGMYDRPWDWTAPLATLGNCASGGFEFWGCNTALSPTTQVFAELVNKPVLGNTNQTAFFQGYYSNGGPYIWFIPATQSR